MIKFVLHTKKGYLKQSIRNTYAPTDIESATQYPGLAQAEYHKVKASRMYDDIKIQRIIERIEVDE